MAEGTLNSGIETIVWLPGLDLLLVQRFFEVFTHFGGSYDLYMFPFLVWCVGRRTGARLIPLFALTLVLNETIKEWIALDGKHGSHTASRRVPTP